MAEERTAVLIIRAWLEPHPSVPLRANVRTTTNVEAGFEHTLNLTDADGVVEAVRNWLRDVEASGNGPHAASTELHP
jgi:hypothetical protein